MLDVMIEPIVRMALQEDLGLAGDITSQATITADQQMTATVNARNSGIISGVQCAQLVFRLIDPAVVVTVHIADGNRVCPGDAVLTAQGPARAILAAERVALNFMGHLSGIATATADMVRRIADEKARIVCTRKTTPGLRALEKQAVVHGGGCNHRLRLDDAILIKDNHIAAVGSIPAALDRAKAHVAHMTKIEIEVDTLTQLDEVITHGGADNVLLDNMNIRTLQEAVRRINGCMVTEASGNVSPDTVQEIAQTGIDYISSGWLTHSAPTLDLGLDVDIHKSI